MGCSDGGCAAGCGWLFVYQISVWVIAGIAYFLVSVVGLDLEVIGPLGLFVGFVWTVGFVAYVIFHKR